MLSLQQFQLHRCIGRGNFGDVYLATFLGDPERAFDSLKIPTNVPVAIKCINLEHSNEPIDLLLKEIYFLSTLRCSSITHYYGTFCGDCNLYIVMEYCGNGSLLNLLRYFGRLDEQTTCFIIGEVVKALSYLHEKRLIHRDLKAANILMDDFGNVKLADLGVTGQLKFNSTRNGGPNLNTFVGTPFWMAPEIIKNEGYDGKCDIWSLGITALELLNGKPPLSHLDSMKALLRIPKLDTEHILRNIELSSLGKDFIRSCLQQDPKKRPNCKQLLQHKWLKRSTMVNLSNEISLIRNNQLLTKQKEKTCRPRFPLSEKVYGTNLPTNLEDWSFAPNCGDENNNQSNDNNNVTNIIMNKKFDRISTSLNEINTPATNTPTSALSPSSMAISPKTNISTPGTEDYMGNMCSSETGGKDNIILSKTALDYWKHVLQYSLNKVKKRAINDSTKNTIESLTQYIQRLENNFPGLSEALVQEISTRMDKIRS